MLQMLQIVPIMWRAVRPSRVTDMPAVKNTFWLRKGYEGLTFFGTMACGDSWLRFYLLYIWYWLKGLRMNRRMPHAAYLLNPFEMEAYSRMYDLHYLDRCEGGAQEWRRYAKMSLEERLACYQRQ